MSQKVLNKVNNDIFSYDTSDGVGVFKMSRVMPTEIHHATGGIGTSGYILTSTGTSGNGWTWSSVNLTDLSDAIATANSLYIGTGSGTISTGNNNTFLGINSGNLNVLGYLNTFIGFSSGQKNDSGFENTFIGAYSGLNNDDGKYNTFIGMSSGILNTSGRENTFVGGNSGYSNKASYNTFVGVNSGYATVDGYSNTFIGTQSGLINTSGRENTFVGVNSGQMNLDGIWNTFIGLQSGFSNSSGSNNTFVGLNAGYYSTESNNTFLGTSAGFHNRAGTNNVAIGYNTQFKQDPGGLLGVYNTSDNEIVIGSSAIGNGSNTITLGNTNSTQLYLPGLQTGATAGDVLTFDGTKIALTAAGAGGATDINSLTDARKSGSSYYIGENSGTNSTGGENTFLGFASGQYNSSGVNNTFVGWYAGNANNTGSNNTYMGMFAGAKSATSSSNVMIGMSAGYWNNTGTDNVAIGLNAAANMKFESTNPNYNVMVGGQAGYNNLGACENVYIGWSSGIQCRGNSNVFIGYNSAPAALTNTNSIYIGKGCAAGSNSASDEIVIGASAIGNGSNTITLGNTNSTGLYIPGLQTGAATGNVLTFDGTKIALAAPGGTYTAGTGLTLIGTTFSNPYNSFYPGNKLYNFNGAGQYGVARVDFTDGNSMAFHGSNYYNNSAYDFLDFFFTQEGIQIGSVTGANWRGSQILSLNAISSNWEIYTFGSGATNLVPYSDDRIKTHEQTFSGETYINYIKQIVPKKYKKYGVILTEEEEKLLEAGGDPFKDRRTGDDVKDTAFIPQIEYGVIAQDIHKISGLEDIVKVGNDKTKWSVDYRSIDTITLGAVKGLIDKIETLENEVKQLKAK